MATCHNNLFKVYHHQASKLKENQIALPFDPLIPIVKKRLDMISGFDTIEVLDHIQENILFTICFLTSLFRKCPEQR